MFCPILVSHFVLARMDLVQSKIYEVLTFQVEIFCSSSRGSKILNKFLLQIFMVEFPLESLLIDIVMLMCIPLEISTKHTLFEAIVTPTC